VLYSASFYSGQLETWDVAADWWYCPLSSSFLIGGQCVRLRKWIYKGEKTIIMVELLTTIIKSRCVCWFERQHSSSLYNFFLHTTI
jgi:hypothetical protein